MNRHVIACLFIAAGARCVLADPGDDFANNLFTDLSPLLALFGERVTMQFLSQAIGVADCIMLAMAPLGIITIIVSAIRVGGPMWLKATIGRARESLSRAEIELMSSTSKETSELWDGHNIVRCSGEGEIWQFICLVPKRQHKQKDVAPEIEVMSLDEAEDQDHKLLKPIEITSWQRFRKTTVDVEDYLKNAYEKARKAFRDRIRAAEPRSLEEGSSTSPSLETDRSPTAESENTIPRKTYVVRDLRSAPPNLTLNCHTYFSRYYHYAVAFVGTVLQLLVLVYAGLITYRPTWRDYFLKNDKPMDSYAFPTVAVGTVLLAIGVFLCGHVVETSTKEDHYKAADGYDAYIVWLQRSNTVGDQKFDPCAIYPVCKRQYVTFSHRTPTRDSKNMNQTKSGSNPSDGKTKEGGLEFLTMVATAVCLIGYLIQFIGLRGMNWSASIAQLVVVALMTILRALVRRDLDKKPMFNTLVNGYEIDWLAISLMSEKTSWRGSTDTPARESAAGEDTNEKDPAKSTPDHLYRPLSSWTVITGEKHTSTLKSSPPPDDVSHAPSVAMDAATRADQALKARIRLGKLANWRGPVAIEAVKLTEAIEAVMAALIPRSKSSSIFSWIIPVRFEEADVTISVQIKWINGAWKAPADKIEAILSLWLYSIQSRRKTEEESGRSKQTLEDESDSLLRAKESPEGLGLRVLSTNKRKWQLLRDLRWWIPKGIQVSDVLEIWPSGRQRVKALPDHTGGKTIQTVHCRVVGNGVELGSDHSRKPDQLTYYAEPLDTTPPGKPLKNHDRMYTKLKYVFKSWLAIESFDSLERLYVQDLFFAFMCAIATCYDAELPTSETEVIPQKSDDTMQNLGKFALTNTTLSRLAHDVHGTGMGSLQEAWFSIVTPLSLHHKLPIDDILTRHAQLTIEKFQGDRNLAGIGNVCCWLLDQAVTFTPTQSYTMPRALAIVLRQLSEFKILQIQAKDRHYAFLECVSRVSHKLRVWKEELRNLPSTREHETLDMDSGQNFIYTVDPYDPADFGIPKGCIPPTQELRANKMGKSRPNFLNWTCWHYATTLDGKDAMTVSHHWPSNEVKSTDIWGWTPLHYACWRRNIWAIKKLLLLGAQINVQGNDGISPMHCAVRSGDETAAKLLINAPGRNKKCKSRENQFQSSQDYLGNHPVHLAAINGHVAIVELLKSDLDLADGEGRTALHLAVLNNDAVLVEWLVKNMKIETINKADVLSRSALEHALQNFGKRKSIIGMIVEVGADLPTGKSTLPEEVLHEAIDEGDHDLVGLLLAKGVRLDLVQALQKVVESHMNPDIVDALLNSDRSINGKAITLKMQNYEGSTPLHTAVKNAYKNLPGYRHFLSRILEYNPEMNFNIRDEDGKTPLDLAEDPEIRGPLIQQIKKQKRARLKIDSEKTDALARRRHVLVSHYCRTRDVL